MKTRLVTFVLTVAAFMPALAQQPPPTPSPTPTGYVDAFKPSSAQPLAERQARTAQRLSTRLTSGERSLLLNLRMVYDDVWHNPDGLTPQQVCDSLGKTAGNLFIIAGYMQLALYQIDPAGIGDMVRVPPGYAVTINADGTVTLTYTPPPDASPSPAQ